MYGKLNEHDEHCRRVVNELERIADGKLAKCEKCGEEFDYEEDDCEDGFSCPSCGEKIDEVQLVSMYDWLNDALDIDVLCSLQGEYKAAKVCIGWGGPNVYVDTWESEVKLYWGGNEGSWYFSRSVADKLDEAVSELFTEYR